MENKMIRLDGPSEPDDVDTNLQSYQCAMENKRIRLDGPSEPDDVDANLQSSNDGEPDYVDTNLQSSNDGGRTSRPSTAMRVLPNPGVSHDDEEYNMRHAKRGLALIFNHYQYGIREYKDGEMYKPPNRNGTDVDADALYEIFSELGFQVKPFKDKSHKDIKKILKTVAKRDHSDHDCLAVAVLTHGECGGRLDAYDREYDAKELWKPFSATKCGSLAGKPKLFFIQACRGRTMDPGTIVSSVFTDAAPDNRPTSFQVPSFADFLISYSTFEGQCAFREDGKGSWYVQTLCKQLKLQASSKDLVSLLTDVSRIVGQQFCSYHPTKRCLLVQGPCFMSSLTRRVHLWPPIQPEANNV